MYFDRRESAQRNFPGRHASSLQARLVSGGIWNWDEVAATAFRCRTHLPLDPDSGIWRGKNLEPVRGWPRHLKGAELVRIAQGPGRESRLTLVFAVTQRDNFGAKHQRTRAMLAGIRQGHGIHGNGYVSPRMAPVWVSLHGDLVKEATEGLVRSTEVPRWRISDGGHRAKERPPVKGLSPWAAQQRVAARPGLSCANCRKAVWCRTMSLELAETRRSFPRNGPVMVCNIPS